MRYFSPAILDGSVTTVKLADNAVSRVKIQNQAIDQAKLATAVSGVSGSLGALAVLNIVLPAYPFFPMIHGENATDIRMSGHEADGASANAPRFAFYNSAGSARTYDVDWRYIT